MDTTGQALHQQKVDMGMLNAIKNVLADVSSVSPSSEQYLRSCLACTKDGTMRARHAILHNLPILWELIWVGVRSLILRVLACASAGISRGFREHINIRNRVQLNPPTPNPPP